MADGSERENWNWERESGVAVRRGAVRCGAVAAGCEGPGREGVAFITRARVSRL